jgi:hypothetical protein
MRRGLRVSLWVMLLVGMEHFANHHRQAINELLVAGFGKTQSDST